ncbi:hypothetical protein TRFO_33011 [Tritrichomonas foetus]|uniref:C2 domain-containing protein n=1 Tax=Tritrichomonas foetus TaxID=1144522 RepID=A0A1J4JML9_9EUKA|nr:hypothetical protein TRFO_33011 [Tritrichomonas foetus]|eukprot:OHT00359.1 hypothetical protein TRFO_33011 [Tritrichomonas foetus]
MAVRLHIKICEARKVLKMDLGGKSDPYITLKLKSQEKKKELIKRTQVISNTTDPIWNQEFDIVAELSDTLLIDMFDEDIKKDDKMMDQLSYPVNKWKVGGGVDHLEVDLKLKKKKAGTLVFEVEAFEAEGSAPPPEPVQERAANLAVPCKLHIRAVDGKGLKKMDVGGKSDPYLTFQLKSDKKSKQKSQVISNSCDPVWNQDFVFNVADWNSEVLLVNMWDEDIAKDDKMMNELEFPLASWPIGSHNVFDDNIKLKKKSAGHLHLEFNVLNVDDAVPANEAPPAAQAAPPPAAAGSVQVRIKIYDAK